MTHASYPKEELVWRRINSGPGVLERGATATGMRGRTGRGVGRRRGAIGFRIDFGGPQETKNSAWSAETIKNKQNKECKMSKREEELVRERREELEKQKREKLESQRRAEVERQEKEELEKQKREELESQRRAEVERQEKEELEKQKREEMERQRRAEVERLRRAEVERLRRAELERQRRAEVERKKREELERQEKEELEKREKEELEKREKEELERQRKEEEENNKQFEQEFKEWERQRLEREAELERQKQKEELELQKREVEQERRKQEEEQKRRRIKNEQIRCKIQEEREKQLLKQAKERELQRQKREKELEAVVREQELERWRKEQEMLDRQRREEEKVERQRREEKEKLEKQRREDEEKVQKQRREEELKRKRRAWELEKQKNVEKLERERKQWALEKQAREEELKKQETEEALKTRKAEEELAQQQRNLQLQRMTREKVLQRQEEEERCSVTRCPSRALWAPFFNSLTEGSTEGGTREASEHRCGSDLEDFEQIEAKVKKFGKDFSEKPKMLRDCVLALYAVADAIDEDHKAATLAGCAGAGLSVAGGIIALSGAALAPFTGGASLVATVGVGGSFLGSITRVVGGVKEKMDNTKRGNTVDEILYSCQQELQTLEDNYRQLETEIENLLRRILNQNYRRALVNIKYSFSVFGPALKTEMFKTTLKSITQLTGRLLSRMVIEKVSQEVSHAATAEAAKEVARRMTQETTSYFSYEAIKQFLTFSGKEVSKKWYQDVARTSAVASGIASAILLPFDAKDFYKDAAHLNKGAKSEIAEAIRNAARELELLIDYFELFKNT